jgi:hypothetical protein
MQKVTTVNYCQILTYKKGCSASFFNVILAYCIPYIDTCSYELSKCMLSDGDKTLILYIAGQQASAKSGV